MPDCQQILTEGLAFLGLPEDEDKRDKLMAFIELILKWNKAYNLTAIRNKEDMARLHILDSLAILPHLHGKRLADIGTGAGLPGIPLAIYRPDMEFVLVDSNSKKTRFVQQAILELKLKNVRVEHSRVEQLQKGEGFDIVTSRAFASLSDMLALCQHLLVEDGVFMAMKGQKPDEELAQIQANYQIIDLKIPNVDAERCLVCIKPTPF